jgi:hypothetical protein
MSTLGRGGAADATAPALSDVAGGDATFPHAQIDAHTSEMTQAVARGRAFIGRFS